jgi:hypothetical protein
MGNGDHCVLTRVICIFKYLPENQEWDEFWAGRGRGGRGVCLVRLVENKSGSAVGWVLEMTEMETVATTGQKQETRYDMVIPWMMAVADPKEKWWEWARRNPKQSGEISQAAFLLKARTMGFKVALPWGDSERYDFVVWAEEGGPMYRVQVKGTGRLYRRGYEVQPVHSTRGRGKKRYTAKEIDVVAAHVQPVDAWYVLPIAAVGRAKSLRFYPDIRSRKPMWEEYREAWDVLEGKAVGKRSGK